MWQLTYERVSSLFIVQSSWCCCCCWSVSRKMLAVLIFLSLSNIFERLRPFLFRVRTQGSYTSNAKNDDDPLKKWWWWSRMERKKNSSVNAISGDVVGTVINVCTQRFSFRWSMTWVKEKGFFCLFRELIRTASHHQKEKPQADPLLSPPFFFHPPSFSISGWWIFHSLFLSFF